MAIEDLKKQLAQALERSPEDVSVVVDPLEGENFILKLGIGKVSFLDTNNLVALTEIAKNAGMEIMLQAQDTDELWVQLIKQPITLSI